jgi:hypothetical protein
LCFLLFFAFSFTGIWIAHEPIPVPDKDFDILILESRGLDAQGFFFFFFFFFFFLLSNPFSY